MGSGPMRAAAAKEELFNAIDACISIIREKAVGEESITAILTRTGIAPVFEKIYSK